MKTRLALLLPIIFVAHISLGSDIKLSEIKNVDSIPDPTTLSPFCDYDDCEINSATYDNRTHRYLFKIDLSNSQECQCEDITDIKAFRYDAETMGFVSRDFYATCNELANDIILLRVALLNNVGKIQRKHRRGKVFVTLKGKRFFAFQPVRTVNTFYSRIFQKSKVTILDPSQI